MMGKKKKINGDTSFFKDQKQYIEGRLIANHQVSTPKSFFDL